MSDTTRAITAHHAELARDLRGAVEAAESAPSERSAAALVEVLDRDLLPHAKSEELHLYRSSIRSSRRMPARPRRCPSITSSSPAKGGRSGAPVPRRTGRNHRLCWRGPISNTPQSRVRFGASWPSRRSYREQERLGAHAAGRGRTIVSSILNRWRALTSCGIPADMRTISPACATTGFPPITRSTSPSSTCK